MARGCGRTPNANPQDLVATVATNRWVAVYFLYKGG